MRSTESSRGGFVHFLAPVVKDRRSHAKFLMSEKTDTCPESQTHDKMHAHSHNFLK